MTTVRDFEKKCAVCAGTSEQTVLTSTSSWGYPDLDFRPSQMQRSSMFAWLDECPYCGYVAGDIEDELATSPDILKGEEYLTCGGYEFKSDLSERFFRRYLIAKAENKTRLEFRSLLHCAWTCDDADDELAVEIRRLALESIGKIDAEDDEERINLELIRADLLRRSMQFDEVISEFAGVTYEDELKSKVMALQLELASKGDSGCYAMDEIPTEVTLTLDGRLLKKLKFIANMKRVSLDELIERMLEVKASELDSTEKIDELFE